MKGSFKKRLTNIFQTEKNEPFFCIGYYLYDVKIEKKEFESIYSLIVLLFLVPYLLVSNFQVMFLFLSVNFQEKVISLFISVNFQEKITKFLTGILEEGILLVIQPIEQVSRRKMTFISTNVISLMMAMFALSNVISMERVMLSFQILIFPIKAMLIFTSVNSLITVILTLHDVFSPEKR